MPDAARVAQAQALEVPVIVQGAKTATGTDRRELFTENATTTLVFDNGAVLHLQSQLAVGQVLFLRNERNGREVLCKVVETPQDGRPGQTELEFTAVVPGFWDVGDEQAEASAPVGTSAQILEAAPQILEAHVEPGPPSETAQPETPGHVFELAPVIPEAHVETEPPPENAPAENTLDMMSSTASSVNIPAASMREELVPTYEAVGAAPVPAPEDETWEAPSEPAKEWRAPTGEEIDAAVRTMAGTPAPPPSPETADASSHSRDAAEPNDALNPQHLAALMARDARLAKYAAAKEKQTEKLLRNVASKDAPEGAPPATEVTEPEVFVVKIPLSERLTTGRNAIIVEIVAGALIVVALWFIWSAMRPVFFPVVIDRPVAVSPPKPKAPAAAPKNSPTTAPAGATTPPPVAGASAKAPQPAAAQKPATPVDTVAKVAASAPATGPAPAEIVAKTPPAPVKSEMPASRDTLASGEAATQPKQRKPSESNSSDTVPARILSQPQPALPAWAKGLGVEGVVRLDAVIDEKGNVTATKVLSGPRELQREAQRAVGLWIFAPAQSAGKPTSSHMELTVEFQQ